MCVMGGETAGRRQTVFTGGLRATHDRIHERLLPEAATVHSSYAEGLMF